MNSIDRLVQEASQLSEDQRLRLAHLLLVADQPVPSEDVGRAWDLVIRERIERYDRGEVHSRPASDVFADLDHRLES